MITLLAHVFMEKMYGILIGAIRILSGGEVLVVSGESNGAGIRPLIKLVSEATGTVDSTVTIDK